MPARGAGWVLGVDNCSRLGETEDQPLQRDPMHLASDYIHPYKDAWGRPAHCRVRLYLPDDLRDAPVVICSELSNNPGGSITNSTDTIAAGVIRSHGLPTPLVCSSLLHLRNSWKGNSANFAFTEFYEVHCR